VFEKPSNMKGVIMNTIRFVGTSHAALYLNDFSHRSLLSSDIVLKANAAQLQSQFHKPLQCIPRFLYTNIMWWAESWGIWANYTQVFHTVSYCGDVSPPGDTE
jgi:hypothetical protein